MKRVWYILVVALALCACKRVNVVDYVNPLIGTDYTGNTYPGVTAPFGMVQISPDNGVPGWNYIAGYYYPDTTIAGFSHTHLQGTGAGDMYDISFMPVTCPWKQGGKPLGIYSNFLHERENSELGYYSVFLADYDINVELTASERIGMQRYTFPQGDVAIFLNLAKAMNWDAVMGNDFKVVDATTVVGSRFSTGWARDQRVYFATEFSRPFENVIIDTIPYDGKEGGVLVRFDYNTTEGDKIVLRTALSCTSEEMALLTLKSNSLSFDECVAYVRGKWNEELGKVKVEGGTEDQKSIFYTSLYHAFSCPTLYCDLDSSYFGFDKKVHKGSFCNYTTFSLWDTYRAAHPLYTILQPQRVGDMVSSMLAQYDEMGRLPVWSLYASETDMMIGYHSVAVLAEAYMKGIRNFDVHHALEAAVTTASLEEYRGIGFAHNRGYVPYDVMDAYNAEDWSLSRTLEYAYDDYCIAKLADALGEKSMAERFEKYAQNYRNLWNSECRFFVPRDSAGAFQLGFDALEYTPHICESNGWQYLWSVQHDVEGLMELLGGEEAMALRLDSMFSYSQYSEEALPIFSTGMIGQYAHGNEPSHHVAYLYNYVHQPWKTAELVTRIMTGLYKNAPDGLCGNEDCGQMSAWFVFSAMGFYPVSPISCRYELGLPLFDEVKICLDDGKKFIVRVHGRAKGGQSYIERVRLNGMELKRSYISHEEIMNGGRLDIYLTDRVGVCWYD